MQQMILKTIYQKMNMYIFCNNNQGLLTKLLHLDPLQRITAKEALELDYFDQSDLN